MRSYRVTDSEIAVSAFNAETAINTEQDLDLTIQVSSGDLPNVEPRREDDTNEMNGSEEAKRIYDTGQTASGSVTFEKAQPHQVGFLLAYALGDVTTVAAGSTGYKHTMIPIIGDVDERRSNPSFSLAARYGDSVLKRLFGSCFMDSVTLTFSSDNFVKAAGQWKSTGKTTDDVTNEIVAALDNVTELTLDANGVYGADANARLVSIHAVLCDLDNDGMYEKEITVTAVSSATPAVLTIESAGGAGSLTRNYKIIYRPVSAATWLTFPAKVQETPMRTSETAAYIGGVWNGTTFTGGHQIKCEAKSIEWSLQNNMQIEFCFGVSGSYAGRGFRDGRKQTLKIDREFRDTLYQHHITENDTFALRLKNEGAEYETGYKYTVDIIFPKVAILKSPIGADGKRLKESAELTVMKHDSYASVIAIVQNKVATYAA